MNSIKIFAIGGGANNAVNLMLRANLFGSTSFVSVSSDKNALIRSCAQHKILLCKQSTETELSTSTLKVLYDKTAANATKEIREEIAEILSGIDIVLILACCGGSTSTNASPIIVETAKLHERFIISIVTKPFRFEGSRRMSASVVGIDELKKVSNLVLILPYDNLSLLKNDSMPSMSGLFGACNYAIYKCLQEVINTCILQTIEKNNIDGIKAMLMISSLAVTKCYENTFVLGDVDWRDYRKKGNDYLWIR